MPSLAPLQIVILASLLISAWALGFFASTYEGKWRRRYRDERKFYAQYRDETDRLNIEKTHRIAALEAENAKLQQSLAAAAAIVPAVVEAPAPHADAHVPAAEADDHCEVPAAATHADEAVASEPHAEMAASAPVDAETNDSHAAHAHAEPIVAEDAATPAGAAIVTHPQILPQVETVEGQAHAEAAPTAHHADHTDDHGGASAADEAHAAAAHHIDHEADHAPATPADEAPSEAAHHADHEADHAPATPADEAPSEAAHHADHEADHAPATPADEAPSEAAHHADHEADHAPATPATEAHAETAHHAEHGEHATDHAAETIAETHEDPTSHHAPEIVAEHSEAQHELMRVRGIDAHLAKKLGILGIHRVQDLERLSAEDEKAIEIQLGLVPGHIASEQWRLQAALLGSGEEGDAAAGHAPVHHAGHERAHETA